MGDFSDEGRVGTGAGGVGAEGKLQDGRGVGGKLGLEDTPPWPQWAQGTGTFCPSC